MSSGAISRRRGSSVEGSGKRINKVYVSKVVALISIGNLERKNG